VTEPGERLRAALGRLAARLAAFARPRACALCGAFLGLAADWYGVLAGLLIGAMLDEARAEAAARAAIDRFLGDPESAFPPEPLPGLAAAAALALGTGARQAEAPDAGGSAPAADTIEARALFERMAGASLPPGRGPRRQLERILDRAASRPAAASLRPALARALATRGGDEARRALADCAFALAAARVRGSGFPPRLRRDDELGLRALLADCGLGAAALAAARARAFPEYRDPWEVLGLAPGSPLADVKRAYRRLSRRLHPDAAGGSDADAAAFRELKDAYEELSAAPAAES